MSGVLVVGFGNSLAGDDGAGPALVERLRKAALPPGARVEDGGSDSLRLSALWQGEREIWLVDALVRKEPPGSIVRLSHEETLSIPQRHATVHHLSLPESLRLIVLTEPAMAGVRYRLWGIVPASIHLGDPMSAPVAAAVELVAGEILRDLSLLAAAPA
jgi:hydrogenase maturation protease